jgi:hypothetical protein
VAFAIVRSVTTIIVNVSAAKSSPSFSYAIGLVA